MIEGLLLVLVFVLGTWIAGWWWVALAAALWGWWRRGSASRAGAAGALAWGVLLAINSWPALIRLAPRFGGVFGMPGWVAILLPPLFAFLLGWSAARVAGELARAKALARRTKG
jgi:hypothetical protein